MATELCVIMNEEGSDKTDLAPVRRPDWFGYYHNYTIEYSKLFSEIRNSAQHIFEVGLGTNNTDVPSSMGRTGIPGASLRGWARYFPNATIYGADVDRRVLFQENRIKTFYVDQTNSSSIDDLWTNQELVDIKFDVIIDDGLHECNANILFFEGSFHKLKNDGYYIIEDVNINNISCFQSKLEALKSSINFSYEVRILYHPQNNTDNCIIIIKKINF